MFPSNNISWKVYKIYKIRSNENKETVNKSPCARVAIGLVEQLAQVFCVQSAPFQHLDTCIRFPSLSSILAPHFSPQADHDDFVVMYKMVIERLNKGKWLALFLVFSITETFTEI